MEASILDLRRKMSEIVRALDRNETITILYRGKKKGVLVPAKKSRSTEKRSEQHPAFGMWKNREDLKDVNAFVRNMRKGRLNDI